MIIYKTKYVISWSDKFYFKDALLVEKGGDWGGVGRKIVQGPRAMVQNLRALTVLAEVTGSIPSNHMEAHNHM